MAFKSVVISSWLLIAMGARFKKKSDATKIAGVQVTNYREDADDFTMLFKKGSSSAVIKSICAGRCAFEGNPDAGGLAFAAVRGRTKLEELLTQHGDQVELLEPDEVESLIPELDEEEVGIQWGEESWGLPAIGADKRPNTGKGVHIYVHDTGARTSHSEFGGRATSIADVSTGEFEWCAGSSKSCAKDSIGHGTHCAGTTSGRRFGVAPDSKVYSFKVLADNGFGQSSWNMAAIDWVVTTGRKPAVVSLSLGAKGQDPAYKASVDTATAAGVTVVAAAGNFGSSTCDVSPAFVPNSITVAATTSSGGRAAYSNFGDCNDIFAPGSMIYSAGHTDDFSAAKMTGTSMSCPHVSGAAALLLERNPTWKRDDIMNRFKEWGKIDAVAGRRPGDPDLFLWVGRDPPPGPKICPDWAKSAEPNYWGDCQCKQGFCSTDGRNKNCPTSYGPGGWGGDHFTYSCRECKCY